MAILVKAGADNGTVDLTKITRTSKEGGGGYNVYTMQSTAAIATGVTLQLQFSLDNGTNWTNVTDAILDENAQSINIVLTANAQVKMTGLASAYTGTVIIN